MNDSGLVSLGLFAEEFFFNVFLNGKLKERMKKVYLPNNKFGAIRSSEEIDQKEGTDFFFKGIRFDISICYDFHKENYNKVGMVEGLQETIEGCNCTIYLGVRDNNGNANFERPVIVAGGCCNTQYEVKKTIHFMCNHWDKVFEAAKQLRIKYKEKKNEKN